MEKKEWIIPVTWECFGTVTVEAETLEKAMQFAEDEASEIPLPHGDYVDGSWRLSCEDTEYVRQCYNSNQPDAPFWSISELLYQAREMHSIYVDAVANIVMFDAEKHKVDMSLSKLSADTEHTNVVVDVERECCKVPLSCFCDYLERWQSRFSADSRISFKFRGQILTVVETNIIQHKDGCLPEIEFVIGETENEKIC